ncbi:LOW QUALITY PROTEIN: solute carrier family 22 member 7-like [Drosophila nasuta]|uniref:LOW QUALITY PROTEIN: solute carrier family 22 member 7-like n=1 Tax=Drosophila nasuta TaxID=42062 RepID=UPI00295EBDA9|nr:LOW QUALITY PROTEIN: solute carrier family 22 member 7-like [Drosophila nasuta]
MEHHEIKSNTDKQKPVDVEPRKDNILDALIINIGQCGRFQIINYVMLCLPIICNAVYSLSYVFTASSVGHRCSISECDNLTSKFIEPWLNFSIPENNGKDLVKLAFFNSTRRVACDAGYKFKDRENTISREFDIFCSDKWKLSMVGTVNNVGQFVGIPLGGYLSDRYGRKLILVITGVLSALCGLARSYAPDYYTFLSFEFLDMTVGSTLYPTAFLLAIEFVGPKHRVVAATFISSTYGLAEAGMGYLAGYILDWRVLLRLLYTPALLHLIFICYLPESVRWLLSQSREEDAIHTLRRVARINQRSLPEDQLNELIRTNRELVASSKATQGHYSAKQIFSALGLRIAQCCFLWFTNTLITLGLTLNSVGLSENKFQNFSMMGFMQLPGIVLSMLLMHRIGRRWTLSMFLSSSAVLLLTMALFAEDYPSFAGPLYFLAKMTSTGSFMVLYFFTSEIFPTSCRNSLLSFCSMVGRFGSMLAPQTPLLINYYKYAPHLLFATFGLLASVIAMFFPETANKVLPTTLEEARALDRSQQMKQTKISKVSKTAV